MKHKISPHVQIYRFPITAITSITNRVTGLGLTGIFVGSGLISLAGYDPVEEYKKLKEPYKTLLNYTVTFPTVYHTYGGIRHFIWDKYPSLLNNSAVKRSSFVLLGSSLLSTYFINEFINK